VERVCGVVVDVDGTLTEDRASGSYILDLEAVLLLRELESAGIPVILATGNSAPVTAGLARYIGLSSPHVSENGCVVVRRGRIAPACTETARTAAEAIESFLREVLRPSWQNSCRLFDYAYTIVSQDPLAVVREARKVIDERGLRAKVSFSGYALHVRPPDASKGIGIRVALNMLGIEPDCVVAVGDSAIDAEMKEAGVYLVAVGNADDELKSVADEIAEGPSSTATKRVLRRILSSL
jgi:hypothetical protein